MMGSLTNHVATASASQHADMCGNHVLTMGTQLQLSPKQHTKSRAIACDKLAVVAIQEQGSHAGVQ